MVWERLCWLSIIALLALSWWGDWQLRRGWVKYWKEQCDTRDKWLALAREECQIYKDLSEAYAKRNIEKDKENAEKETATENDGAVDAGNIRRTV